MVRVSVIGCGYWGKNLVRNFSELGALHAVSDYDANVAANFANQYGVKSQSFEEVLADPNCDAVAIAAPAELHAELALKALNAKKHVFVEKPIALTESDGQEMENAANSAECVLMVGHLLQYHPAFTKLRTLTRQGVLGKVQYVYSNRLSTGKFRIEENALWSLAPHDVSMILSLIDEVPSAINGAGGAFVTPKIEDEYRLDLSFPSGARAHVFVSWLHPFKEQRLVVVGDKGMAVFEDSHPDKDQKLRLYRHQIDTSGPVPVPNKAEVELVEYDQSLEPLQEECRHFLECCSSGRPPITDAKEANRVLSVLVAAS